MYEFSFFTYIGVLTTPMSKFAQPDVKSLNQNLRYTFVSFVFYLCEQYVFYSFFTLN